VVKKKAPAKKTVVKKSKTPKTVGKQNKVTRTPSTKKGKEVRISRGNATPMEGFHTEIHKLVPKRASGIEQEALVAKCAIEFNHPRSDDRPFVIDYINRAVKKGFLNRTFK